MSIYLRLSATVVFAVSLSAIYGETVTIPAGFPLRIQVDRRYHVRKGMRIEGRLISPIFSRDQEILPVNVRILGEIQGERPAGKEVRARALIDGDFTPPTIPEVRFESLQMPNGEIVPIRTLVVQRDARVVKMSISKKGSKLTQEIRDMIQDRRREAIDVLHHPNFGDRTENVDLFAASVASQNDLGWNTIRRGVDRDCPIAS
jgi:hypothetical protein